MSVNIENSSISLNAAEYEFVGATGAGIFPPSGVTYDRFSFKLQTREPVVLIFGSRDYPTLLQLHRVWWDGDKVIVDQSWNGRGAKVAFNRSTDVGLIVTAGHWHYFAGKHHLSLPENSRQVDPITLVKYIEGKISEDELHRATLKRRRAIILHESLQQENRRVENQNRALNRERSILLKENELLVRQCECLIDDVIGERHHAEERGKIIGSLTESVNKVPWLVWRFIEMKDKLSRIMRLKRSTVS